jgi:hypothetical protein
MISCKYEDLAIYAEGIPTDEVYSMFVIKVFNAARV